MFSVSVSHIAGRASRDAGGGPATATTFDGSHQPRETARGSGGAAEARAAPACTQMPAQGPDERRHIIHLPSDGVFIYEDAPQAHDRVSGGQIMQGSVFSRGFACCRQLSFVVGDLQFGNRGRICNMHHWLRWDGCPSRLLIVGRGG